MLDLTHFLSLLVFIGLGGLGMAAMQDGVGNLIALLSRHLPRASKQRPSAEPKIQIGRSQSLRF